MLPECRLNEYLYPMPIFDIEKSDVEGFVDKLPIFHAKYEDCFVRNETRESLFKYMVGLFNHLERKSIEPIAINVAGNGSVRSMQRSISDAIWFEDKMLRRHQDMVSEMMGDSDGVLIFDETGFVKKGGESAGVGRQYCGSVGKVENSQVGVFMGYASGKGYTFLDKRLYIQEKWFGDEYKDRRKKCELPEDVVFKSKPELAAEMLLELIGGGVIPFRYIAADTVYGDSPAFIGAIEARVGITYMAAMPCGTLFWKRSPVTREKTYTRNGEPRAKTVLADNEGQPISFEKFAGSLNGCFWYERTVSEGSKGPIKYEFTKRNITLAKDGLPWKNVWLIIKRTVGKDPEYSYYISNAPVSAKLSLFVWLSGIRWAIEQCFEESKCELGMDHYEVRKYNGWNRHMLTCMLSHFFLWQIKIELGEKAPFITPSQIRILMKAVLPIKTFSTQDTIDLVRWIQVKNHKAYLSHRKRKLGQNGIDDLMDFIMG